MRDVAALAVVELEPEARRALPSLSRDVLREAANQARGGLLVVLGIVAPLGRELFWADTRSGRILHEHRKRLREARARLRQHVYEVVPGVPVVLRVQAGPVADLVARHAAEARAGLIVVGDRAQHPVARWLAGRSFNDIVRRAPCPVLVVPDRDATGAVRQGVAA